MAVEGERVIRRAYRAFAARDVDALVELADPDVEVSTVTGLLAGRPGPYRGRDGLTEYMDDLASTWERIELQPQRFLKVGEGEILVYGRVRAWHQQGFLDSSNAWLWTLREGKVAAVRVFADPAEARGLLADPSP